MRSEITRSCKLSLRGLIIILTSWLKVWNRVYELSRLYVNRENKNKPTKRHHSFRRKVLLMSFSLSWIDFWKGVCSCLYLSIPAILEPFSRNFLFLLCFSWLGLATAEKLNNDWKMWGSKITAADETKCRWGYDIWCQLPNERNFYFIQLISLAEKAYGPQTSSFKFLTHFTGVSKLQIAASGTNAI